METSSAGEFFRDLETGSIIGVSIPFAVLLLCIAVAPLVRPHLWERNRTKIIVAAVLALPIAGLVLAVEPDTFATTLLDYGAFIALLAVLFTISGGIFVRGSFAGRPATNAGFLVAGAVLANAIGTTGASMLLIRPLIRANERRSRKWHVFVFFIFVVSNAGGLLTPLGDPPLFLGFLNGVPFFWTLRLWETWLFMVGSLAFLAWIVDRRFIAREPEHIRLRLGEARGEKIPLGIDGGLNTLLMCAVIGAILVSGYVIYPAGGGELFGEELSAQLAKVAQILVFSLIAIVSFRITAREVHRKNTFHFGPLIEVAILFAGIFVTMVPVLRVLEEQGASLGVDQPWHFFWITGGLSSVLDNTPTYLTFSSLAKGVLGIPSGESLDALVDHPAGEEYLIAISAGAVLMGAMTYIGNGPNFMVKAIAEAFGVRMPTFFGYVLVSSLVLLPLSAIATVIFFL